MRMAKASEKEMEDSIKLSEILLIVDKGYFPLDEGEDGEELDTFFDPEDIDHLKRFHRLVMKNSQGIHRITWGFHTLMHNDVVDPDDDCLEFHPRIVKALKMLDETEKANEQT